MAVATNQEGVVQRTRENRMAAEITLVAAEENADLEESQKAEPLQMFPDRTNLQRHVQ